MKQTAQKLVSANRTLARACGGLRFSPPVAFVYNPAHYARSSIDSYFGKYGNGQKRVLFLGMNPGPWGMAQTGIPFGEVNAARDFLKLGGIVGKPPMEHPKRRIDGFDCPRSEVSGARLWAMFARKFGAAEVFFGGHFVLNYCPLLFLAATGANITPDKLAKSESAPLFAACDIFLRAAVDALRPHYLIGIGAFAEKRLRLLFDNGGAVIGKILHPSPASPAANRNFAQTAEQQLIDIGIW
ncbi:MAG: uracil-DNA glycosylase family protein [Gammaproteobacteria bacterium]